VLLTCVIVGGGGGGGGGYYIPLQREDPDWL